MIRRRAPIVQERILPAAIEEVFAAWSDPESLRVWMCPGEVRSADAEVDFRVGGSFRIVMHETGRDYVHHGEYLEIDPPRRLVFTWVSEFLPEDEAHTRVSVSLEPAGPGRTRLRLVHDELPDTGSYDGHESGWGDIVGHLSEHLKGASRR